ncbi:MAG: nucleotidyltransferase family protein, partial [Muribaculaceae bacterium]|nr:nucleotidyltransferase family protein [Muribaculaceae bacterium]
HVSDETDLLRDTGGGILHASRFLEGTESVVLQNADIYTDFDLHKMIANHTASGADVTILGEERETKRYLFYDETDRLRGWGNLATGEVRPEGFDMTESGLKRRAYGCVQIFNPSAVLPLLRSYSPGEEKFGIFPFYIDNRERLDIRNYTPAESYRWFDIGRPESITHAEEVLKGILK